MLAYYTCSQTPLKRCLIINRPFPSKVMLDIIITHHRPFNSEEKIHLAGGLAAANVELVLQLGHLADLDFLVAGSAGGVGLAGIGV